MTAHASGRVWCLWLLLALPLVSAPEPASAGVSAVDPASKAFSAFAARAQQPGVRIMRLDPAHTAFGFELRTRWGQLVQGQFPVYEGVVLALPDGRRQVRIRLAADEVDVAGSERYTVMARGEGFFDAARHPDIEFVSDPHDDALARNGGPLRGHLRMHGVTRPETFAVAPAACTAAGQDCDAHASGSVTRSDYGIGGLRLMLSDRVRFTMQVRLLDRAP